MGDRSDSSSSYPPVGSPDRYDMIVQRGRALRRRRRYTLGAGAGGTVVALALAVVFVTGGGAGDEVHTDLAEDPTTTTEATTSTTTTVPPQVSLRVDTTTSPGEVVVSDLEFPLVTDAQQCVLLTLRSPSTGTAVAGAWQCRYVEAPASDEQRDIKLPLAEDGLEIECAKSETRIDENELVDPVTAAVSTTFAYDIDDRVPAGEY